MTRVAAASRPSADFHPANALYPHVVIGATWLRCLACGVEAHAPLPREDDYSNAVERFLQEHRRCQP